MAEAWTNVLSTASTHTASFLADLIPVVAVLIAMPLIAWVFTLVKEAFEKRRARQ